MEISKDQLKQIVYEAVCRFSVIEFYQEGTTQRNDLNYYKISEWIDRNFNDKEKSKKERESDPYIGC